MNFILFLKGCFLSLRRSGFKQFYNLAPKMENELSWILSLDLLIYKLPASENLVLYVWRSDEQVKRSQIFWGAELVDMSCIREHTQIWPIRTKLEVHNKLVFYKKNGCLYKTGLTTESDLNSKQNPTSSLGFKCCRLLWEDSIKLVCFTVYNINYCLT